MTTTATERTRVEPLRWSLATLHVKALLENDADGRRF